MEMTVLLHLTAIGTAADLIGGKIPNGLIAAGLLCGAAGQAISSRGAGLACWLAGAALPVLLFGGPVLAPYDRSRGRETAVCNRRLSGACPLFFLYASRDSVWRNHFCLSGCKKT